MSLKNMFDVNRQLTFYAAYHSNAVNILIHSICVPLIFWTVQVFEAIVGRAYEIPTPIHVVLNDYLVFDLNFAFLTVLGYFLYYFALEPIAALFYIPTASITLLTANAFSYTPNAARNAGILSAICWALQFLGHGLAEKRAPALFDNLVQAFVLAPFFVHLELLFSLGYNPTLHKNIQNGAGKEIVRIRKIEGDKRRAAEKKEL